MSLKLSLKDWEKLIEDEKLKDKAKKNKKSSSSDDDLVLEKKRKRSKDLER